MNRETPARIGRYEVTSRLGQGGMGLLYLARDPKLGRTVAIKVLSVDNEQLRGRFSLEARVVAALKHPNIVTIYDVGEEDGAPFIAMEYIEGETLGDLIQRRAPLPLSRKIALVIQLCEGLGYAHTHGIIHRDIKPRNLMLAGDSQLKILDFGLARAAAHATDAGISLPGAVLGTPNYMSPEQIEARPIDHRCDVFAAGLVLFELLTYRKAYTAETPHGVWDKILNGGPPSFRDAGVTVPADLEAIVLRAAEKAPGRRFQSLEEMANALRPVFERSLAGLPDSAGDAAAKPAAGRGPSPNTPRPGSGTPKPPSAAGTPRPRLDSDAVARRRADLISGHLRAANEQLEADRLDDAMAECEALLVIDPEEPRGLALLDEIHRRGQDRQVQQWLADASSQLSTDDIVAARELVTKVLTVRPDSTEAQRLGRMVSERELTTNSQDQLARDEVNAARQLAASGNLQGALLRLGSFPGSHPLVERTARELTLQLLDQDKKGSSAASAGERVLPPQEREARATIEQARRVFAEGEYAVAIQMLESFQPAALVEPVLTAMRAERARVQGPPLDDHIARAPKVPVVPPPPQSAWQSVRYGVLGFVLVLAVAGPAAYLWMRNTSVDRGPEPTPVTPGIDVLNVQPLSPQPPIVPPAPDVAMPPVASALVAVVKPVRTPPAPSRPAATPAIPVVARDAEPVAPPPPEPVVEPQPVVPPPPPAPTDAELIGAVLREYQQAYESRDASRIARVVPLDGSQVRTLDTRLRQLTSFTLTLRPQAPQITSDGTRASVTSSVTTAQIALGGERTQPVTTQRTFDLEKSEAGWKILRVR